MKNFFPYWTAFQKISLRIYFIANIINYMANSVRKLCELEINVRFPITNLRNISRFLSILMENRKRWHVSEKSLLFSFPLIQF